MWKYGILHLIFLCSAYALFGCLYGFIFLGVTIVVIDRILSQLGYCRLNYGDLSMLYELEGTKNNIAGYFVMNKIGFEAFKAHFFEKALMKIPRMRSKLINKFGINLWKDIGLDAGKQLVKWTLNLSTEDELIKHCEDLCNEQMDFSKPLWKISLLENYSLTESVVFINLHHSFTDAGGILELISWINDKDKKIKVDKAFPKINIFMHLFFIIIGPFYSIYLGMKLENDKTDQIAAKIGETKGKISNRTKFYAAKERIPFLKLKNATKG